MTYFPKITVTFAAVQVISHLFLCFCPLCRQLVSAIHYLHKQDIGHRDLKCENVLITATDSLIIGDFGFARSCRDVRTKRRILSETFCGSAAYAAPEILQVSKLAHPLADQFGIFFAKFDFEVANFYNKLFILVLGKVQVLYVKKTYFQLNFHYLFVLLQIVRQYKKF